MMLTHHMCIHYACYSACKPLCCPCSEIKPSSLVAFQVLNLLDTSSICSLPVVGTCMTLLVSNSCCLDSWIHMPAGRVVQPLFQCAYSFSEFLQLDPKEAGLEISRVFNSSTIVQRRLAMQVCNHLNGFRIPGSFNQA